MNEFVSPRLGIRFEPGLGAENLNIFSPDGSPLLSFAEWVEKAKADEQRAAVAVDRANRLAARLRELGVDPE